MKSRIYHVRTLFTGRSMLRRMIVLAIFVSVIPAVCVGLGSYWYSAALLQKEINRANVKVLGTAADSIDSKLQSMQGASLTMLFSQPFIEDAGNYQKIDETSFKSSVYQSLSALRTNYQGIEDVALYMRDRYVISPLTGGVAIDNIVDRFALNDELHMNSAPIHWETVNFRLSPFTKINGVSFVSSVPLQSPNPTGLLIVVVDPKLFKSIMERSIVYSGEAIVILNKDGSVVASSGSTDADLRRELVDRLGTHTNSQFMMDWKGRSYLFTNIASTFTNWSYIDLIPVDELNRKSRGIAYATAAFITLFLLICVSLAWFGTRRVYKPIGRLVDLMKKGEGTSRSDSGSDEINFAVSRWSEIQSSADQLKHQLEHQLPALQERFGLQLLLGQYVHYSSEELATLAEQYGIPPKARYSVMLLTYDRHAARSRFSEKDRDLVRFSVQNVASDLLFGLGGKGMTINLLSDHVAIWLWDEEKLEEKEWRARVHNFAERIYEAAEEYLKITLTIGISSHTDELGRVDAAYREAMSAVRMCIVIGGEGIMESDLSLAEKTALSYPAELDIRFENALRSGDAETAREIVRQFGQIIRNQRFAPEAARIAYNQLLASALRTASLHGMSLSALFGDKDPYAQLVEWQRHEQVMQWFEDSLIGPITQFVADRHNREYEDAVRKVEDYIGKHYHEDLSLDRCAEICGLSPTYLSKLFKRIVGQSFIDYMTSLRVEKAKKLLLETDLSVNDIAVQVGYQPQNFIRVFKRLSGMTPGQYRESPDEANSEQP